MALNESYKSKSPYGYFSRISCDNECGPGYRAAEHNITNLPLGLHMNSKPRIVSIILIYLFPPIFSTSYNNRLLCLDYHFEDM